MLSLVTFIPILGGLLVAALPEGFARRAALLVSLAAFAASIPLWTGFSVHDPAAYQLVEDHPWIGTFGIRYHLGIDGVSLLLVLLTTILTPIIVLAGFTGVDHN